jgi:hypothetical protein
MIICDRCERRVETKGDRRKLDSIKVKYAYNEEEYLYVRDSKYGDYCDDCLNRLCATIKEFLTTPLPKLVKNQL